MRGPKNLLRQPAVAGLAPLRPPTIANQDRALPVDGPVSDRNDGMAALGFRRLANGGIDHRLRSRSIESARQHQENNHRPALV